MVRTLPFTNTEISLRSKWQVLSPGQCQRASDLHRLCWTAFNYALTSDDKIIYSPSLHQPLHPNLYHIIISCCCSAITEFSSTCTRLYFLLFFFCVLHLMQLSWTFISVLVFCSYLHVLSFMIILSHKPSCILTGDNECRYVSWPIDHVTSAKSAPSMNHDCAMTKVGVAVYTVGGSH